MAPSSGFPTDRRRSDCLSESHQPQVLRTRCIADPRGAVPIPSSCSEANFSQFARFSFRTGSNCASFRVLWTLWGEKGPGAKARPHEPWARRTLQIAEAAALPPPERKSSPSRERFRPPSRRTFRFRVVLLGGLRPTGAPCSAQAGIYGKGPVRSRGVSEETSRKLRGRISRSRFGHPSTHAACRGA